MQKPYSCIIVDDDEIDRLTTVAFVKQYPAFSISGVFASATEALAATAASLPTVAFFDIDMPGLSGLALRQQLQSIPVCVFITAYPDYAAESFEQAALDYIVKPLRAERFAKTAARIEAYLSVLDKAQRFEHTLGADTIFIREGHQQVKIALHEVIYLEALKDYTGIVTAHKKYCVLSPLSTLLREPAFAHFLRIHRSYAVQKHYIEQIGAQEIMVQQIRLPVGRQFRDALAALKS